MPTLTLQLGFDPSNPLCDTGRFLADATGSNPPIGQRSKVWIQDTGTGQPTVTNDRTTPKVQLVSANSSTPTVQVTIVANLPQGYSWGTGDSGYSMRIVAVFGRARHAANSQDYASPFGAVAVPSALATVFDLTYIDTGSTSPLTTTLQFGQARFGDAGATTPDNYSFNVGVVAFIVKPGQTTPSLFTFGHDPDLNVGN